ncbi:hypothetical protein [Clostridium sp. C8-1-8]|uniref:hypothetical protein n=1 Tax=Clostridium sp. C8-1-8 TaxID=2698831 RepID=UPI00136BF092|nr:hypothetical protein [Clostridium sp. C8-1-8]
MFFTNKQYNKMYELIYDWLANHTSGDKAYMGDLKYYQKELWNLIIDLVNKLSSKSTLNDIENEFLNLATYTGPIYRIQHYNPKNKGYIFENKYYQSWSRDLKGASNVPISSDKVLLIVGYAVNGIDVFGLLYFLFKNEYITEIPSNFKKPDGLCRYEKEEEISYSILFEHITDVVAVDKNKLLDWQDYGRVIPMNKWRRNSID